MKAWGKIQAKHFFSFRSTSEAVTPIIGFLLMLLILVVLASTIAISFFNIAEEGKSSQPLMAKISLESCEGGLSISGLDSEQASFEKNKIVLVHEGGSPLPLDAISIKVSGDGNAYQGYVAKGGIILKGSTEVIYQNLNPTGKNPKYESQNKEVLKDNIWSVGEKLVLHGNDSSVSSIESSVKAGVNGDYNTSDNYGFKVGSEVTLKVIDTKRSNVISEQRVIVKHAEG